MTVSSWHLIRVGLTLAMAFAMVLHNQSKIADVAQALFSCFVINCDFVSLILNSWSLLCLSKFCGNIEKIAV
jgi:hypothetical protein